jgi:hypothetical protein
MCYYQSTIHYYKYCAKYQNIFCTILKVLLMHTEIQIKSKHYTLIIKDFLDYK